MTLAARPTLSDLPDHLLLDNVSWDFYDRLLKEIGNRHIYVTYDDGRMEIMSPLPEHEKVGAWIARLVELMCLDREIPVQSLGSTTFRTKRRRKGFEPDKCFYIQHADHARTMSQAFDPPTDPPPDLAVEIDITSRSIDREPIYAAVGVPELWRFDGRHLHAFHLSPKHKYLKRPRSLAFPFLDLKGFETFILRITDKDQIRTLRDFRKWCRSLPA